MGGWRKKPRMMESPSPDGWSEDLLIGVKTVGTQKAVLGRTVKTDLLELTVQSQ